jgi:hypothetical protein
MKQVKLLKIARKQIREQILSLIREGLSNKDKKNATLI